MKKTDNSNIQTSPDLRLFVDPSAEEASRAWLERLKSDFRLAMVSLFGLCAVLIITPFSVYRFATGEIFIGIVDTIIVATFVAIMVYAWRTGRSGVAGIFTAAVGSGASIFVIVVLELSYIWMFSALVANFLLANRGFAIFASATLLVTSIFKLSASLSGIDLVTFVAVSVLISLFALIFASRVDSQHQQLSDLASLDPLTGAGNRRALKVDLAATVAPAGRHSEPCGLAVLDLDHFKEVNDNHGHEAGDHVLMDLARIVQESIRRSDRFYRFGGEEFVLLMPGADHIGLEVALEKLQQDIRKHLRGPAAPVTVSIGAANLEPGEAAIDCLSRADKALYRAKENGRDCIVIDAGTKSGRGADRMPDRRGQAH